MKERTKKFKELRKLASGIQNAMGVEEDEEEKEEDEGGGGSGNGEGGGGSGGSGGSGAARHLQRDRVDHDDLIAVQELALRRDRAARLDLDDDVVERQADPEAVLKRWRIEQQYISDLIPQQNFWPREWCLSFKHSILPPFPVNWFKTPELPADARIVAFTGHPDPDEALEGKWPAPWYKRHYKHVRPTLWIGEHWR